MSRANSDLDAPNRPDEVFLRLSLGIVIPGMWPSWLTGMTRSRWRLSCPTMRAAEWMMGQIALPVAEVLDRLEPHYGPQAPCWPTDPYRFIVWWHCGYPPSDAACLRGWESLTERVGTEPSHLLAATSARLTAALRPGGMVPELRARRLKEVARRVQDQFGGNLRKALAGRLAEAPALLKEFPGIAAPGADRILLFAGLAPIAAVPSNGPHVLVRIRRGREHDSYGANYREAQQILTDGVAAEVSSRSRAYLLLKQHGQVACKRTKPACESCPLKTACAFVIGGR